MQKPEIELRVRQIISENFGVDDSKITRESTLESLDVDSLDKVELVMELEEEFRIEIPDQDIDQINTVDQVIDYVGRRLS